ncbi:DUF4400 domain-containing protein [Pseudoduganella sp. UC29_71]|uniref:DUF4400 domain-containing protein n=1 Tax=Pseudoduganella sp. UC29_71 TaxID=3350174 RepID=UPI00366C6A47
MIRIVSIASLLGLLVLVLYLPSATPASAFVNRVRAEHGLHGTAWGQAHAQAALARALSAVERPVAAPLMPIYPSGQGRAGTAAGRQLDTVGQRIVGSGYLRSLNALLLLAVFRLAALAQLAPGLLMLAGACLADGLVRRWVKSREFSRHHPEIWIVSVCLGWLAVCGAVICSALPIAVPVALLPLLASVLCACIGMAIANYPAGGGRG